MLQSHSTVYENAGAIKVVRRLKFVDALRKSLRFAERESYGTIQYMLTVVRFVVMVKTLAVFLFSEQNLIDMYYG